MRTRAVLLVGRHSLTDIGLFLLSSALQGLGLETTELRPVGLYLLCTGFDSWAHLTHKRVISHSALHSVVD